MSQKNTNKKSIDWKEQQQKYTQTAKNMFEKFASQAPKVPKIDYEALMIGHKKNIEALTDANKMATEVLKSIAQLQGQFVKQAFADINQAMQDVASKKDENADKLSASADAMKQTFTKALEHAGQIGNVLKNSGNQIHARMKEHAEDSMAHAKEHFSKYKH